MAQKPSIPKGTRDFSPVEMRRRQYILDTIRGVFERYGYLPIETPAMEKLETLTGKYGEEGDRLIFKVLKRGMSFQEAVFYPVVFNWNKEACTKWAGGLDDEPNPIERSVNQHIDVPGWMKTAEASLADQALRYDLTVPFARFVVQHQHALTFPFKRYQMQPVWRADRPQKGRYREFLQCDADVIGSTSLLNEVELVQLFDDVFTALGLSVVVKLNDRKLLTGIAEVSGQPEKVVDIVTALDKLDKVGREAVEQEMRDKGVSEAAVTGIAPLFELQGTWDAQRTRLAEWLGGSGVAQQGLADMDFIFQQAGQLKSAQLEFDPTLARGLDYYTGAIFEVKAAE
ncbi:MAG TPA: ATP phosphoribosyltransferase regulatory subunit, partial [Flavobacteriales bacterium]|nr:ATP phosphoribosyltransferase regulatory subunit [Flavobacteriales bacterium]